MAFPNSIKELCTPAMIYFLLSMITIIISLIQNLGNSSIYELGCFSCPVTSTTLIFIVKIIYVFFWTYVLNLICKDGKSLLSWLLVFFPFIMFMLLFVFFMLFQYV